VAVQSSGRQCAASMRGSYAAGGRQRAVRGRRQQQGRQAGPGPNPLHFHKLEQWRDRLADLAEMML